jgi:hypothetical protein
MKAQEAYERTINSELNTVYLEIQDAINDGCLKLLTNRLSKQTVNRLLLEGYDVTKDKTPSGKKLSLVDWDMNKRID